MHPFIIVWTEWHEFEQLEQSRLALVHCVTHWQDYARGRLLYLQYYANVKTNKLILYSVTDAITRTYYTRCHQLSARTAHKGGYFATFAARTSLLT